ncbi:hypothetical protein [Sphingomonas sp. NFX23]|uniref:hypothetical protein n=1 Tax=Sphingomonas sp. NFX23 TaxID=2819532 RepID=UPI003CEF1472
MTEAGSRGDQANDTDSYMRVGGLGGLIACGLLLAGCVQRLPTLRYRLTVEIETPFGLKAGSSVIEVTTVDQGKGFPGPEAGGVRRDAKGQAVVIEIAPHEYVFALLGKRRYYDYADGLPVGVLQPLVGSGRKSIGPNTDRIQDYLSYDQFHKRMIADHNIWPVPRTVPANAGDGQRDYWPDLVRFRDLNNPKTLELIATNSVNVKRVTLQIVDEPVTTGISAILPWLDNPSYVNAPPMIVNDDETLIAMTRGNFIRK